MTLATGVLAGSWFLILTVLVLDLVGVLRRGTGFRWQAGGLLIINTAVDFSRFALLHRRFEFGALQSIISPVMLIGFAIFGMGLVIQIKAAARNGTPLASRRRRVRAAQAACALRARSDGEPGD